MDPNHPAPTDLHQRKYAVFFRNVNLGRPKSPSKTQLERAFLEKLFDLPATMRNWNTVIRLVQKHA